PPAPAWMCAPLRTLPPRAPRSPPRASCPTNIPLVPEGDVRWRIGGGTTVDKEMRRNICRLIAGIVVADDDLEPAEEAFLDKLLAKFEIPASERDSIFPIVDRDEAAETIRGLPKDAQSTTLAL